MFDFPPFVPPDSPDNRPPPPPKPYRKRGAPRGNTNAVKHGFYSSRIAKPFLKGLENYEFSGLYDEITLLRIQIGRYIEMGSTIKDIPQMGEFIRILSLATSSLARLLRVHKIVLAGDVSRTISDVLAEVVAELDGSPPEEQPPKKEEHGPFI